MMEMGFRYRVNVSKTSKGLKSYDCTVEGFGFDMKEVLKRSDALVIELDERYPSPSQEGQNNAEGES